MMMSSHNGLNYVNLSTVFEGRFNLGHSCDLCLVTGDTGRRIRVDGTPPKTVNFHLSTGRFVLLHRLYRRAVKSRHKLNDRGT